MGLTPAERQRRRRQRAREGLALGQIEIDAVEIAHLIESGLLAKSEIRDSAAVGRAVVADWRRLRHTVTDSLIDDQTIYSET